MDVCVGRGAHARRRIREIAAKLERALQALDDGVQIKRRIIEELRPTLLDNLGLAAALEWQVHEICDRAGHRSCTIATLADRLHDSCRQVIDRAFRILQEALTNIVKYAKAKKVDDRSRAVTRDHVIAADRATTASASPTTRRTTCSRTASRHAPARARDARRILDSRARPKRGTMIEVTLPLPKDADAEPSAPAELRLPTVPQTVTRA